jgi:SnoaL-like domain
MPQCACAPVHAAAAAPRAPAAGCKNVAPRQAWARRLAEKNIVNIEQFMQGYKEAWEQRDEARFAALFAAEGEYHNTPFAVQRGRAQLAEYWRRVKLQEAVRVTYEVLASSPAGGIAHWHVTYQVASEELFQIWAQSTGTNLVARKSGDPLPRMVLDGMLKAEFAGGLCTKCEIWWHSMPQAS